YDYDIHRLIAPRVLRDFSFLQYKYADREHANAALLIYARLLEELQKTYPEDSQKNDLAIAYTRLALLEDAADNQEQSRTYITKARPAHSPLFWRPRTFRFRNDIRGEQNGCLAAMSIFRSSLTQGRQCC